MARNKKSPVKKRLARAARRTRRAPVWVMSKTKGEIRTSIRRRNWRRSGIKP
ncbi:MAG: 50S ribosomal protein L39e [Candidatus Hadarchaeaceae archaeon]